MASTAWKSHRPTHSLTGVPLTREQFAAVLLDLRRQHRLSAEKAARKIGISTRQYSRLEGATSTASLDTIDKAITAYNVDPTVFLGEPEVTPGDVATRLQGLEGKVDRLLSEMVPALAAIEADLNRLAQAAESNGRRSPANGKRKKAS